MLPQNKLFSPLDFLNLLHTVHYYHVETEKSEFSLKFQTVSYCLDWSKKKKRVTSAFSYFFLLVYIICSVMGVQ